MTSTDKQGVPETTEDASPFGVAWRAFVEQNPRIETLPAGDRAMLRRGFVYGWRAKEIAECLSK